MKNRILSRLQGAKGEYLSGTTLARELGITRTAVWKHIINLKKAGYQIEARSNKGYCLEEGFNAPGSVPTWFGRRLLRVEEVDSTNSLARELLGRSELPEGTVIVAERQNQGRGRRGRKWESPEGGLWLSLVLYPDMVVAEVAKLSLVFAWALADCLERLISAEVKVKWPNDIMVNGRKVAGILLEIKGEFDKIEYVITGIGVNVNLEPEDISAALANRITSLMQEAGHKFTLEKILLEVLSALEKAYTEFIHLGWPVFRQRFIDNCIHYGHPITVQIGDKEYFGIDRGVDEWGCLLLETSDGAIRRLSAGDVLFDE